jgi:hypothetical protein
MELDEKLSAALGDAIVAGHPIFEWRALNKGKTKEKSNAVAQVVSLELPKTVVQVQSQVGFMVDKVALGCVFSEYFCFCPDYSNCSTFINHPVFRTV